MPSRNRSADAGIAERDDRPVEIVGEPIPCQDARHRIRQAFELLQLYTSTVPTRTGPLMLAAAYARVSTDRQDREQTIDSQIDVLRRAAEQRGWHLAADLICRDDGRTGTTLARPGLDRLRDLVAEGTCAAVLVCSPDRLARNFAHQVLVIDEFRRSGCEVVFLNHAFGDSPEQQMLLQM
jgi:site-specific DNA recombinase